MSSVQFSSVEIIELPIVAGACHPAQHNGPSDSEDERHPRTPRSWISTRNEAKLDSADIALDWEPQRRISMDIERYEQEKENAGKKSKMKRLTRAVRKRILRRSGVETSDIDSEDERSSKKKRGQSKLISLSRFRSQDRFSGSKPSPCRAQEQERNDQESKDSLPRFPKRCALSPEQSGRNTLPRLPQRYFPSPVQIRRRIIPRLPKSPLHSPQKEVRQKVDVNNVDVYSSDTTTVLDGTLHDHSEAPVQPTFIPSPTRVIPEHVVSDGEIPSPRHSKSRVGRKTKSMQHIANAVTSLAKQPVKLAKPVKKAYKYSAKKFSKKSNSADSDDDPLDDTKRGKGGDVFKIPDLPVFNPLDSDDDLGIAQDEKDDKATCQDENDRRFPTHRDSTDLIQSKDLRSHGKYDQTSMEMQDALPRPAVRVVSDDEPLSPEQLKHGKKSEFMIVVSDNEPLSPKKQPMRGKKNQFTKAVSPSKFLKSNKKSPRFDDEVMERHADRTQPEKATDRSELSGIRLHVDRAPAENHTGVDNPEVVDDLNPVNTPQRPQRRGKKPRRGSFCLVKTAVGALAKQPVKLAKSTKRHITKNRRRRQQARMVVEDHDNSYPPDGSVRNMRPRSFNGLQVDDLPPATVYESETDNEIPTRSILQTPPSKIPNAIAEEDHVEPEEAPRGKKKRRGSLGYMKNAVGVLAKQPVKLAKSTKKRIMKKRRKQREKRAVHHGDEGSCSSDGSVHSMKPQSFTGFSYEFLGETNAHATCYETDTDNEIATQPNKPTPPSRPHLIAEVEESPKPTTRPNGKKIRRVASLGYMKNAVGTLAKQPAKLAKSTKKHLTTRKRRKNRQEESIPSHHPKLEEETEVDCTETSHDVLASPMELENHRFDTTEDMMLTSEDDIELIDDSLHENELDSILAEDQDEDASDDEEEEMSFNSTDDDIDQFIVNEEIKIDCSSSRDEATQRTASVSHSSLDDSFHSSLHRRSLDDSTHSLLHRRHTPLFRKVSWTGEVEDMTQAIRNRVDGIKV